MGFTVGDHARIVTRRIKLIERGLGVRIRKGAVGRRMQGHFLRRVKILPPAARSLLLLASAASSDDPAALWRAAALLNLGPDAADPAVAQDIISLYPRGVPELSITSRRQPRPPWRPDSTAAIAASLALLTGASPAQQCLADPSTIRAEWSVHWGLSRIRG
jgi:hypothetical protein